MEYSIIYILSDHSQHMTELFTRYQDAKKHAIELAAREDTIEVWIEGYEKVLDLDLKF